MSDTTPQREPVRKRAPILPKDVQTGPVSTRPGAPRTTSGVSRRWGRTTLAVIFGLLYAYDVWEGLDWLVGGIQFAGSLNTSLSTTGWVSVILAVIAPAAFFMAAFLIARRRAFLLQILIYLAGLAGSAAFYFSIVTLFPTVNIVVL